MTLKFESPLNWPQWIPVTPRANQRNDHGFTAQMTLEESINFLTEEITALHASGMLSLDVEQPMIARLRKKAGNRLGAALQLRYQEANYVLACDRWQTVEHNIYALHLAIRAWRNIERWGIAPLATLLAGFEAQAPAQASAAGGDTQPWMERLGLGLTATLDDALAVYHRRAKQAAHDTDELTRLNSLMDEARAFFKGKKP